MSILTLIFTTHIAACSALPTSKRAPEPSPNQAKVLYKSAQSDLNKQDLKSATSKLSQVAVNYPTSELAPLSYYHLGEIAYQQSQFEVALNYFKSVLNGSVSSDIEFKAAQRSSLILQKLNRLDEAESMAKKAFQVAKNSKEQTAALKLLTKQYIGRGQNTDAIRTLIELSVLAENPNQSAEYRRQAIEITEGRLNENQLERIAQSSEFSFLRPYAFYRLGEIHIERRSFQSAKSFLSRVDELIPSSDLSARAIALIQQIDALRTVDSLTVGAVLPLTGKHKTIGEKALRGLQLGLGVYGNARSPIKLAVIDSEGNPDTARRATERLITENNSIAIVGSLLSRTAQSVASKADELGVPNIALSPQSDLTLSGDYIFRNAVTAEMQVKHLVEVAMKQNRLKRFAILYPNDSYGVKFATLFWEEVEKRGGEIRGAQVYNPSDYSVKSQIQRLVGTFYVEDRIDEFEQGIKKLSQKKVIRGAGKLPQVEEIIPPIVDFDAIFIPDGVRAVSQIIPMLDYNDVRSMKLLGTNLWNTGDFAEKMSQANRISTLFVDGFFVDSTLKGSQFWRDFNQTFAENPVFIEQQAYETGLILRQLLASGSSSRSSLKASLERLQGFPGATSRLQMNKDREIERPLSTLTVLNGKVQPLTEALSINR